MKCPRCRNVLMLGEMCCPACGTVTAVVKSAAAAEYVQAAIDPHARRKFFFRKWTLGLLAFLIGGGMAAGGAAMFFEAGENTPVPRKVTAAELLKIDNPAALPDWITFTTTQTIATRVEYVKMRSRRVTSKFFLLQVQDRWLLAKVDADFRGARVEGKLTWPDSVALPKVHAAFPREASRLLPYQIDAEFDVAATQRRSTVQSCILAGFGLLILFSGLGRFFAKAPPYIGPAPNSTIGVGQFSPAALPQTQRPPRSVFVRTLFIVVWAVAFFFASAILMAMSTAWRAGGDAELQKQLAEESGQMFGPWMLLGTLVLAVGLGCLGRLPGTRR